MDGGDTLQALPWRDIGRMTHDLRRAFATAGPPAIAIGLAALVVATEIHTDETEKQNRRNRLARTINPFRRYNAVLVED